MSSRREAARAAVSSSIKRPAEVAADVARRTARARRGRPARPGAAIAPSRTTGRPGRGTRRPRPPRTGRRGPRARAWMRGRRSRRGGRRRAGGRAGGGAGRRRRAGARPRVRVTCRRAAQSCGQGGPPAVRPRASRASRSDRRAQGFGALGGEREHLGRGAGHSSRTTWPLVPPSPNELTPARERQIRRRPGARARSARRGRSSSSGACGLGDAKFRLGGSCRCSIASAALTIPTMPGGALQVSDVGLGRAHQERRVGRAARAEDRAERPRLDGIAERRARAVRLDVLHRGAGSTPARRYAARSTASWALRVGGREAVARAVVVDGAAADHAVDGVAVGDGAGEGLEDDHAAPLAADVAVGARVERVAAAVLGERAEARRRRARSRAARSG